MTRRLTPKKSETVEIRIPHETKAAFMARCRAEGRTASDAIRRFIDHELDDDRPQQARTAWRTVIAAALAGVALGAVAAPSLAEGMAPGRAVFDRLDRNHDGVLTFGEYRRR